MDNQTEHKNQANPRFFTVETLAQRWGVSTWTVRQRVWKGELKATMVGSALRIAPSAVAEFEKLNEWSRELCRARTARPCVGHPTSRRRRPKPQPGLPKE